MSSEVVTFKPKYFLLFIISVIACILFLVFLTAWFWVTLPFVCTYLTQAFDAL